MKWLKEMGSISRNLPQPPVVDLSEGEKDYVFMRIRGKCVCLNCGWDSTRTIMVVKKLLAPLDLKAVTEKIKGTKTLPVCNQCFKDAVEFERAIGTY